MDINSLTTRLADEMATRDNWSLELLISAARAAKVKHALFHRWLWIEDAQVRQAFSAEVVDCGGYVMLTHPFGEPPRATLPLSAEVASLQGR